MPGNPLTPNTQITHENVALYERAVMFATRDKPSVSYIQRRLEISYADAAALISRMQREGLISEPSPLGKREILVPYTDRPALSPPAADHIGDATEKVDWARCQRCGGEIQGWICQDCHQEFEENDASELVFCPSESVDWNVVGPKLVVIIQAIAEISGDRAAPGFNEAGRLFRINQRAHEALGAAQPEGK